MSALDEMRKRVKQNKSILDNAETKTSNTLNEMRQRVEAKKQEIEAQNKKVQEYNDFLKTTDTSKIKPLQLPQDKLLSRERVAELAKKQTDAQREINYYTKNPATFGSNLKRNLLQPTKQTLKNFSTAALSAGANTIEYYQDNNAFTSWNDEKKAMMKALNEQFNLPKGERTLNIKKTDTYKQTMEEEAQKRYEDTDALTQRLRDMRAKTIQETQNMEDGLGKSIAESSIVVGDMLPAIGAGVLTGGVGSSLAIYGNAAQNAYQTAIENGATHEQASNNATLNGLLEATIELIGGKALGKLTKLPTLSSKVGGKILAKMPNGIKTALNNTFIKGGLEVASDVLEEGFEEVVSGFIQPFIDRVTYNPDAPLASFKSQWEAFSSSILPTLMFAGINTGSNRVISSLEKQMAVKSVNAQIDNLANKQIEQIENTDLPMLERVEMVNEVKKQQLETKTKFAEEINKFEVVETNLKTIPQNNTNFAKTTPINENISQNNVQNVSNLQNTHENRKLVEKHIVDNIEATTLVAGKKSTTRQKKKQIVEEFLNREYPNNKIDFQINYDTGNVRVTNIYNKQELEEYGETLQKQRQNQIEEYNRKHPDTIQQDEIDLTYNELPDDKQLRDMFEINDKIDELVGNLNKKGYEISVEHSKASADASYINVETSTGTKQIRIANHYKSGVSGNADVNINMSEYGSKKVLLEDIEKAITNVQKLKESDALDDKVNYDVDIKGKNNYNINNEDTELYDDGRATRMGGLVNEFKDKLTSKQWNIYFKRIDNDGKKYNFGNNEKSVIPIGNKLVFSNYINGKPQVYDIVKLESRLLKTYGMTTKQFSDTFINKLVKEGYNETEIREFIRNLGEETLLERNDTSSNIITNRSERTSKNDRQINRVSENGNKRKQLFQEDGKFNSNNDVENSEKQGSFSTNKDVRYDKKGTKKNKNEENSDNFELTRDNILTRIRNEIGVEEFSNDRNELLEIASEIRNKIKDKSLTIDEIKNIVDELGSVLTVKIDDFDVAVEDFINDIYGDGSWNEITSSVVSEIKQFRDEYESEHNILEMGKKAIAASLEIRDVLKQAGFTDFEIYDPANAYIQNILEMLEKDKDYYAKTLKQIEQETLATGEKRMNTILNKRRYDVQSGKTPADPNYSEGTSLRSMRKEIEKYLGKKVGLKGFRARAYGIYKMSLDTIRIKYISNLETTIHELGHRINYRELDKDLEGASRQELNKLAERAFSDMYDDNPGVKLQEGWAEFTKRFVVDNQTTLKEYPELSNYMLEQLSRNPRVEKLITTLIDMAEQYVNAPTETQIRKIQSIGEDTGKVEDRKFFDKYMYEVHDDLWDIKQMTRAFAKSMNTSIWGLAPSDNIYNLMRALRANEDRVLNVMKFGLIDDSGIRRTKGMAEIMERLNNDPEKAQRVRDLLIAMRTLDYASVSLETGLAPEEALSLIAKYSKDTDVMNAANDIINFQEEIMKYAVSKGLMKAEDYQEMKKWNKLYIPLKRVFEGKNASSNSKVGASNLTKRRTGSSREIIDPFESIIQNTAMILTKINQNEIIKTLADLQQRTGLADYFEEVDPGQRLKAEVSLEMFRNTLEAEGVDTDEIDLDVVKRIFSPVMNDDKTMTIGYMDGGKLKAIEFKDKNIYDVITGADNGLISKTNLVLNTLDKFTGLLRLGATTGNLEFALPNLISDTMTAWLFSESGFVPAVDTMRGLVDYMVANYDWAGKLVKSGKYKENNKYMYDLYKQSGATMATRVASYRPEVQEYVLEVFGKHVNDLMSDDISKMKKAGKAILQGLLKAPQSIQDVLSIIPEISEQATRFETFKKDYNYFKKKGYSHKNALLQATVNTRDITMDFNRMGHSMRAYNRIKAFSAARAQGIYRFVEGVEKMPKKVLSKVGLLTAISLSILAAANASGNDKEKEITDQKRKDNFIIPLGANGDIVTIKKPQGTVRSILNLAELIYNVGVGKIKEENYNQAWLNWVRDTVEENSSIELDLKEGNDLFSVISSAALPTALEPIIENALNRDFYYGNPIIPYGKEDLRPEDQYDENTSQTAILIGKAFRQSPAKIENLITGWFAGVGQQVLDVSDWILGKTFDDIPEAPSKAKDEAFITKRFFVSGYKNSESVSQIYDMINKLEDLKEYNEATEEQLEQLKQLNTATDTMSRLNKEMKAVRNNLSLSAKEKQKEILRLQELRTDTARYYLGKTLIKNANKRQIELYEYYPASTEYTYELKNKIKVKVQYTEKDQQRYAEIWKETYETELLKFETSKKYYTMTDEEREKEIESIKTKARNKAQDEVSKDVYEREH